MVKSRNYCALLVPHYSYSVLHCLGVVRPGRAIGHALRLLCYPACRRLLMALLVLIHGRGVESGFDEVCLDFGASVES